MANINDYLLWRGDLPISKVKFSEVDSMILARFSYLLFNKISMEKVETIESISNKMKDFPNEEFRYNGDKEMIINLGNSRRFKNMLVTDFIEHTDKKAEKQFSAITIHVSSSELYISYIGTDSTIVGWKEDFNMAFMESVPAQEDGLKYLINISKKYPDKNIRIGGHSKGGSVAIYSGLFSPKEIQDRIIKVYNYDGPGLRKATLDKITNPKILSKIHTYFPQDSIIGRILEHREKCTVVQSTEKGIYQHDIFSWQVMRDNLVTLPALTYSSEIAYNTINNWMLSTTPEQKKMFFDGIFELFYATDADTFAEMADSLSKNLPKFIKTYKGLSEESRNIIKSLLKEFGKASANTIKSSEKPKLNPFGKTTKKDFA